MGIFRSKLSIDSQISVIDAFTRDQPAREAAESLGIQQNTIEKQYKKIREEIHSRYIEESRVSLGPEPLIGNTPLTYDYWVEQNLISKQKLAASFELFHVVEKDGKIFTLLYSEETRRKIAKKIIDQGDVNEGTTRDERRILFEIFNVAPYSPNCTFLESSLKDKKKTSPHIWTLVPNWLEKPPYEGCEPVHSFCWCVKTVLSKYNSISRDNLDLFLKECEFKYRFPSMDERKNTLLEWFDLK